VNLILQKGLPFLYGFYSFTQNILHSLLMSKIVLGKKQGEIICFDLAYILFAREESIPKLDFILNDKKELMHGNQLLKIAVVLVSNLRQLFVETEIN
ncbi:DUF2326 domain-containing protein, partial [Enterococcus dongliensis]|uniref:DUF2326 domain-containing protein n=1 Tax=Enterococcus dongliensis TaxID=2559925 RepID=UPI00288D3DFD